MQLRNQLVWTPLSASPLFGPSLSKSCRLHRQRPRTRSPRRCPRRMHLAPHPIGPGRPRRSPFRRSPPRCTRAPRRVSCPRSRPSPAGRGSMMGSRRRRLAFAAAGLAGLIATSSAWAEPTAADRETARSLMQEGRELREKGDLQGALKRFQAADGIMHVPTTALEVARTQATLGLLVEARDTIAAIRKTPAKANDPEPFAEARNRAEELDASLDVRVPSLTIKVDGAAAGETPTITIDGVQVPAAAVGLPRRVDPGHHVVAAKTASSGGSAEADAPQKETKQV